MQREDHVVRYLNSEFGDVHFYATAVAPTFSRAFPANLIHQNPIHRLRDGRKEVPSIVPLLLVVITQKLEIRLMYQGRGLQRLPRSLADQPPLR